jgi:hypothetical protein
VSLLQNETGDPPFPVQKVGIGRRLFDRFGSILILMMVLMVVVGWIGAIGWTLIWLLGWYGT